LVNDVSRMEDGGWNLLKWIYGMINRAIGYLKGKGG
jgi:hypothetical protein